MTCSTTDGSLGYAFTGEDTDGDGIDNLVVAPEFGSTAYLFHGPLAPGALTDAAADAEFGHSGNVFELAMGDGDGDGLSQESPSGSQTIPMWGRCLFSRSTQWAGIR